MPKNILITGGAGFVGSNLACFLKESLKDHKILCLDNLIRPGSNINAKRLKDKGISFIKGDIRRKKELLKLPRVDFLIECSAEPSVLAAFEDPNYTIDTNLMGTVNCLELAKRDKAGLIFLSTSRVYPIAALNHIPFEEKEKRFEWTEEKGVGYSFEGINEDFGLNGVRSLYGTTKLSSEMVIAEYIDMFGMKAVINRCGVIAGPWQMGKIDQGLVGYWIAKHLYGGKLKYFGYQGSGKQVRDALHVNDICELIFHELIHLNTLNGKVFNVGGGRENAFSLLELTEKVSAITKNQLTIEPVAQARKADVRVYITDNSRIYQQTGWRPKKELDTILEDTYRWMNERKNELKKVLG